jgi:CheY-like chemotaxis protein
MCRAQVLEKAIRLRCEFDPSVGQVTADPARLQQVFWNLLKNAAKFTPEGGEIRVTTSRVDDATRARQVRDNGIGMDPWMLPRIFDAFEQGDERITRQFGGLGLGLAISKALVSLHNGTISAQSAGTGHGSVFTIDLPAPAPAAAPSNASAQKSSNGDGAAAKLRLLIVEDHADTARLLGKLLCRSGYAVETATTAGAALDIASRQRFDVLISDIGLPDTTGYELMRQLRERYALKGIAMSGFGMDEDVRKSREAGFSDHLVKPVQVAQLEQAIHRVTGEPR